MLGGYDNMATFGNLGSDISAIAETCAGNCDRADTAAFLIAQQDIIQNQRIKDRTEKAVVGNGNNKAVGKAAVPAKKEMESVYAKLMKTAKESK